MAHHPTGRHRRPHRSMTARLWALTATALALALTYVLIPEHPRRQRAALTPPPHRHELPPARRRPAQASSDPPEEPGLPEEERWHTNTTHTPTHWESQYRTPAPSPIPTPRTEADGNRHNPLTAVFSDPDQIAGALVRPYMPPPSRFPFGDLLAAPEPTRHTTDIPDDLDDLAATIRRHLHQVG